MFVRWTNVFFVIKDKGIIFQGKKRGKEGERMRRMEKIIAMIVACSVMIVSVPMASLAEGRNSKEGKGEPHVRAIVDAMADLGIKDGAVTMDCWVKGHYNRATKAKVIVELQVKGEDSWIAYGTWTDTRDDYMAWVYEEKEVKEGKTYRVKMTVIIWEGMEREERILFTDEMTG